MITTKTDGPLAPKATKAAPASKATMRYMAHDRVGHLSMRRAVTRDFKADVRESASRAFALAVDFMHNSGWIDGAVTQIINDTIGLELKLNCRPDLKGLGYSDKQRTDWCRLVEQEWRRWSWNPAECDLEGKATVAEMLDGAMRYYLAGGEAFGIIDYMGEAWRRRYGLATGTKVKLVSPHRVPHYTSSFDGWDGGIRHDEIGRPQYYRFRKNQGGIERDDDVAARSGDGRLARVIHVMDRGAQPNSPRGLSPMAPAFMVIAQTDQLAAATLATFLLQTAFAATITSPEESKEAFEALEKLEDLEIEGVPPEDFQALARDFMEVWGQRIASARSKTLSIGGDATQVNHLIPGEKLELHGAKTPGPEYLSFRNDQKREIARCLGVTFESLSMDHSAANYSSVRMALATIWPIVERRRERIAAPFAQAIYEAWLDEMVWSGRIPFRGGHAAFKANFQRAVDAEWRGPERPSADPYKDSLADKIDLEIGANSLQRIYAAKGLDWEEEVDQIAREVKKIAAAGFTPPHGRMRGGEGAGPQGAAADGMRQPPNA